MYVMGKCIAQDYVEACKWFTIARAHSSGDDQTEYAHALEEVIKSMTSAQLAEAEVRAREWMNGFESRRP